MSYFDSEMTLLFALMTFLLSGLFGCLDNPLDDIQQDLCDKNRECLEDFGDEEHERCMGNDGDNASEQNPPDNSVEEYDEEECEEAIRDELTCLLQLDCEDFQQSHQECTQERQSVSDSCSASLLSDSDTLDEFQNELCDKRLQCDDDFDSIDHENCRGEGDCAQAQTDLLECRLALSCEDFINPAHPAEFCEDESDAASAICAHADTETIETDPTIHQMMCEKYLECDEQFDDRNFEACIDPPGCEVAILLHHECMMDLSCDDYATPGAVHERCRYESHQRFNACQGRGIRLPYR